MPQQTSWQELTSRTEELYNEGKRAEAFATAQQALRIAESTFGPNHPNVASSLNDLGFLCDEEGHYAEAEPFYIRALAIREKVLGPEHLDVAFSLNDLGLLYLHQGRYNEAELAFERALAIRQRALGPDHRDVAISLSHLGMLYLEMGRNHEGESLYKRAVAIDEKILGPNDPGLATDLHGLAQTYEEEGRYGDAEVLLRRALTIRERALGPEHLDVAKSFNNLAVLYDEQGRYDDAEPFYKHALAIKEKILGPDHSDVAISLNNLGLLYVEQLRYSDAEPFLKRAVAIREKVLGPESPRLANTLGNLGELYLNQGRYAEAEPFYKRALAIDEKTLGPDSPATATSLNNLAGLYHEQGRYAEAEPLYRRALAILENAFGADHPTTVKMFDNLAALYEEAKSPRQASAYYDRSLTGLTHQFNYYFNYMSERDRLTLLRMVSGRIQGYFNFCVGYRQQLLDLPGKMYDVILWEKGFIAQSVAAVRAQIEAGGDKEALALLDQLTAKKTQLARLLQSQPADREQWRKQVDQLEQEANDLEKELVKRSAALSEQKKLAHVSWRDVQKALKPGEAAVEFVRFPFYDGKKLTDANYYVALVVTPESPQPSFIVLVDAKNPDSPEKPALHNYRWRVGLLRAAAGENATPTFYNVFWKPLEPALAGAKRIYLSPDGALNQVSLAVVPDANGKLLIERYDLRVLNNTKDLLREKRTASTNSAVLIGNPAFTVDAAKQREAELALQKNTPITATAALATATPSAPSASTSVTASASPPSDALAPLIGVRGGLSRDLRGGALDALPATQIELQSIDSLLEKQNWRIQLFTEQNALKDSVKRVKHPRVLHIATHGFFEPDQTVQLTDRAGSGPTPTGLEDPMLRSGLFFAGANRTLAGEPTPPDLDDGVLTAYEATGLNLQGTELVVLSACETGLGQVSAGEGVFGLRRALQVAGADSVLLSMWSVPDKETQELMTLFYKNWLSGQDKPTALRNAQLALRKTVTARYGKDSPYYWGAFVLVGR